MYDKYNHCQYTFLLNHINFHTRLIINNLCKTSDFYLCHNWFLFMS